MTCIDKFAIGGDPRGAGRANRADPFGGVGDSGLGVKEGVREPMAGLPYDGEPVDQLEHALQCAEIAQREHGGDVEVVVACRLHGARRVELRLIDDPREGAGVVRPRARRLPPAADRSRRREVRGLADDRVGDRRHHGDDEHRPERDHPEANPMLHLNLLRPAPSPSDAAINLARV
jgi:hypothetical protein